MRERDGQRQSLFRYFQGRSSLATWLRAVLAQRHVDRIRSRQRNVPLPEDQSLLPARTEQVPDPERPRFLDVMQQALTRAIAGLPPRDRLRLKCYYVVDMKLAAIGTMLGEHEATVSRHLTRTRGTIRDAVERCLREDHGLSAVALEECVRSVAEDPGALDLCKILSLDRSN